MGIMPKKVLVLALVFALLFSFVTVANASLVSSPKAVSIAKATVTIDQKSKTYDGETADLQNYNIVVKNGGETLVEGVDYVVFNTETDGSAAKTYSVSVLIVGIGHYKGFLTKALSFKINKIKPVITSEDVYDEQLAVLKETDITEDAATNDQGVDFKAASYQKGKIKVNADGSIVLKKGLAAGTYTVTLTTVGDATRASVSKKVTVTVSKAAQSLKLDGFIDNYTEDNKSKHTIKIEGVAKADDGGKLVWASSSKSVTVSSTGVVTLPKGLKKGTYVVSVKGASTATYAETATHYITINIV